MKFKAIEPLADQMVWAAARLQAAARAQSQHAVREAVLELDEARAAVARFVPIDGSLEELFASLGRSVIHAQEQLDDASADYLDKRPRYSVPASFRIPKVTADLKFAVTEATRSKVSFLLASKTREEQQQREQSVHLEIVAVPLPANDPAWKVPVPAGTEPPGGGGGGPVTTNAPPASQIGGGAASTRAAGDARPGTPSGAPTVVPAADVILMPLEPFDTGDGPPVIAEAAVMSTAVRRPVSGGREISRVERQPGAAPRAPKKGVPGVGPAEYRQSSKAARAEPDAKRPAIQGVAAARKSAGRTSKAPGAAVGGASRSTKTPPATRTKAGKTTGQEKSGPAKKGTRSLGGTKR